MPPSPVVYLLGAVVLGALLLLVPRLRARAVTAFRVSRLLRAARHSRHADMARIAAYHHRLTAEARLDALDDRTWTDLDLDLVFLSLDHTVSEPGRQYLYHLLRTPRASAEPLARQERAVRRLASDDALTDRARAALGRLGDPRAGHLVELLYGEFPRRPRLWWLFPLLSAGSVACAALMAVWPRAGVVWLGICAANVAVRLHYRPRVKEFIPALHQIPAFLGAADALGALPVGELAEETRVLRDGARRLRRVRPVARWLMFEPGQASDVAASAYEYVNLLFLLDVNAFVFASDVLRDERAVLRDMFRAIGYIDAAQSIAGWRRTLPRWTVPELTGPCKAMHVEELSHPLVADAVPSSLDVRDTGVLITGSNMSGKSTFVRALGVSAVLAQTLHTACALAWRAPLLRVRTSIGRRDSVVEGRSYYLAEVEAVLELVHAKERGPQHLFLLDEIFRGTNTTERVAAGYAVLAHLNQGADLVVVATHDLELLELLGGSYAPHHFREELAGDGLTFDHRLHPGPSSTRNAIALLRHLRYPAAIVADALAAIEQRVGREGNGGTPGGAGRASAASVVGDD